MQQLFLSVHDGGLVAAEARLVFTGRLDADCFDASHVSLELVAGSLSSRDFKPALHATVPLSADVVCKVDDVWYRRGEVPPVSTKKHATRKDRTAPLEQLEHGLRSIPAELRASGAVVTVCVLLRVHHGSTGPLRRVRLPPHLLPLVQWSGGGASLGFLLLAELPVGARLCREHVRSALLDELLALPTHTDADANEPLTREPDPAVQRAVAAGTATARHFERLVGVKPEAAKDEPDDDGCRVHPCKRSRH